jgi:AraC-like DNA-binding protein
LVWVRQTVCADEVVLNRGSFVVFARGEWNWNLHCLFYDNLQPMYSYIFFALFIVGIFSIIENIKGTQKFTFFKINIQILLFFICTGSFLFFLDEMGFHVMNLINITRIFGTISMMNIYFILANNKIPKLVIYFELIFILISILMFLNGFSFLVIKNGVVNGNINDDITLLQWFNIFFINFIIFFSMFFNIYKIHRQVDNNNLYQVKIKNWSYFLLGLFVSLIIFTIVSFLLNKYQVVSIKADTRFMYILIYFILILFVLLRPKFIDEADFSYSISKFSPQQSLINAQDFDFLFYFNHYYLQLDANIDDFALRLNHSKVEVLDFLKIQTTDSFTDLLNKNRIKYFSDLLRSKKQDSFTIEALSEMSGFKSRKTMYNTFNKYHNMTPSEFINNL